MFDTVSVEANMCSVVVEAFLSHPARMFAPWAGAHAQGRQKPANGRTAYEEEPRMVTQRSTSVRALVIISTTVAALVLLLATAVHAFSSTEAVPTAQLRVHAGDTLWSIAGDIAEPGGDVRAIVATIRDLNDMSSSVIHVGDVLIVPGPADV
jgi:hypothetical protein